MRKPSYDKLTVAVMRASQAWLFGLALAAAALHQWWNVAVALAFIGYNFIVIQLVRQSRKDRNTIALLAKTVEKAAGEKATALSEAATEHGAPIHHPASPEAVRKLRGKVVATPKKCDECIGFGDCVKIDAPGLGQMCLQTLY